MTRDELIAAVPIREFRGRPFYVRIRDIPAPWDAQFSSALYGANCPGFADEGPCAHSHDWESWVNGRWWGGANVPIGLDPDPAHIAYVCNAVRAVYGESPDGLADVVVGVLRCQGRLTSDDLAFYRRILGPNVLELVVRCAQAVTSGVVRTNKR